MSRGFLSGLIWGGVTGAAALAVGSLIAPLPSERMAPAMPEATVPQDTPATAAPEIAAPETAAPAQAAAEPTATEPATPGAEAPALAAPPAPEAQPVAPSAPAAPAEVPMAAAEPAQTAPAPDTEAPLPGPGAQATDAASAPVTVTVTGTETAPDAATTAAPEGTPEVAQIGVPAGSEFNRPLPDLDPTLPATDAAPTAEAAPVVEVPSPATAPVLADTGSAARPDPAVTVADAPAAPPADSAAPPAVTGVEGAPAASLAPAPDAPTPEPAPQPGELPPPPPLDQAALDEAARIAAGALPLSPLEPATPPATADAPAAEPPATEPPAAEPPAEVAAVPPEAAPAVTPTPEPTPTPDPAPATTARPVPGMPGTVAGVRINRPDPVGDPAAATDAPVTDPAAETATLILTDEDLPAVERFARPFENPEGRPLFSVLLIDTGNPDVDRAAIAAAPFPISIVVDPAAPDAATAARIYREGGQEVLMLASGLPAGATAADLEVVFQGLADLLPEAVGLVDTAEGVFQGDRTLSTQIAAVLKDRGMGMVTYDKGLNSADQVAARDGVPAARIFRSIDAGDENAATISRYLDRAAFKAAQVGRVTVIGHTRPETVAALMQWTVEGRSASVALAPATAAMARP